MKNIQKKAPAILAIFSLILAGHQFVKTILNNAWIQPSNNMVMKWDARIQVIRESIPPDVEVTGYIDSSMVTGQFENFDGEEFFLMQYSVAPVVLELGTTQPWIIGNLKRDIDFNSWLTEKIGTYEIQAFGFELYLIHDLEN